MKMPFVGPFKIVEVLERDRYRVVGRRGAKKDHHEFHISKLKLWPGERDADDVFYGDEYFDAEFIVDSRMKNGRREYRVRWQGYGALDDTWVPIEDMSPALARETMEYIRENALGEDDDEDDDVIEVDGEIEVEEVAAPEPDTAPAPVAAAPAAAAVPTQAELRGQRLEKRQERMALVETYSARRWADAESDEDDWL